MEINQSICFKGHLETLAQPLTTISGKTLKRQFTVRGEGSEIECKKMQNRARRKFITSRAMELLIEIAQELNDNEMENAYRNSYNCNQNLIEFNGRVFGTFCKNHHCSVCNGIKKARLINRYSPELAKWEDAQFLTLTFPACIADMLSSTITRMNKAFHTIRNKYQKKAQRGKGKILIGIKSLECNFNPIAKTYNPHFHLIVFDEETAKILVDEWELYWTKIRGIYIRRDSQPYTKVTSLDRTLNEVIKYASKVFTDPEMEEKNSEIVGDRIIYLRAMHNIFKALRGKHVIVHFGFNIPPISQRPAKERRVDDAIERLYSLPDTDWIDLYTHESLSGYEATSNLISILDNMNTILE